MWNSEADPITCTTGAKPDALTLAQNAGPRLTFGADGTLRDHADDVEPTQLGVLTAVLEIFFQTAGATALVASPEDVARGILSLPTETTNVE